MFPRDGATNERGAAGRYARNINMKEVTTMKNNEANILSKPANKANDVTTAQGGNLVTRKVDKNAEPAAPEKTAEQLADERRTKAKNDAKTATVKQYTGNVKGMLLNRSNTQNGNSKAFHDFTYSWNDENGMTCTENGKIAVTDVMTGAAAKTWRGYAKSVLSVVVDYHNADSDDDKAKIRNSIAGDVKKMWAMCGLDRDPKKPDLRDILDNAYKLDAWGDDDAANPVNSIVNRAKQILDGREKQNSYKAKQDAAAAKKATKTESKADSKADSKAA